MLIKQYMVTQSYIIINENTKLESRHRELENPKGFQILVRLLFSPYSEATHIRTYATIIITPTFSQSSRTSASWDGLGPLWVTNIPTPPSYTHRDLGSVSYIWETWRSDKTSGRGRSTMIIQHWNFRSASNQMSFNPCGVNCLLCVTVCGLK